MNKGRRNSLAARRRLPQPYISADTAKYNRSAHELISAAPASYIIASTSAIGISKNCS